MASVRSIPVFFSVFLWISCAALMAQDPPPGAPTWPGDFVGGEEVTTTSGVQGAGTASVIKLKDGFQAYIVSARHLLGVAGGFSKETPAADVPAFVKSVKIYAYKGGHLSYSVIPLLVNSTRLDPINGDPIDDLAIYQLKDSSPQDQAVPLADKLPAVGETVYLIAHVQGGVPEGQRIHPMKVVDTQTWVKCQFDNDQIITSGASGAPVLNAAGECVGVYSSHLAKDGHMFGFLVPAPVIAAAIKAAPASAP
jgi:S1-C subfamily serine protease